MSSDKHSVLVFAQHCVMAGRSAPDSYRRDDGSVSDDVVEYSGTLDELRATADELERVGNQQHNVWMSRAARVIREHCDMYPA